MSDSYRVGLIVPSSNTTMETEIPAMLHSRQQLQTNETFTFHSSRMRMKHVNPEELKKMDIDSERCAIELSDARCDVLAYACLIAIMCQGPGYHQISEEKLSAATIENGGGAPIVSSAGALIEGIETIGATKVSIITPYMKPLTNMVIEYLNTAGIEVVDSISLEVADNLEVGRLEPLKLIDHATRLNTKGADAVVLSACVQMPSLPAIQTVEDRLRLPVLSAATSTVYKILKELNLNTAVPDAGYLLSGKF
ncbi:Asp/Glu racemase [Bacillus canaveralius]|uniref:Maleate isomerase n=2 Tax=Bacillus canaveralius TaxID=1403243 RepID=A0A2N5GIG4_9BACI|nr:Asp/Glu racemase [Bacillus canaveralius]PLR80682.1 Asp/Glu racemase [Bacillus canaveralius]PLR89099.1 Asp/Glu racemase [Bacillus canaveralius]RSK43140.1 Asp/Glu racemase [Bacillus canaveralius]